MDQHQLGVLNVHTIKKVNKRSKYIVGMDEAGRGPVIGPLVIGLVIVSKSKEQQLRKKGVKDSKTLTKSKREELAEIVKETADAWGTLSISAWEIDQYRAEGHTLNQIEVMGFRRLLSQFGDHCHTLQLDAADVNAQRFADNFADIFGGEIIARHKGDSLFKSVGAASILAKTRRDNEIEKLQEKMTSMDSTLPEIGSGYPNKKTKSFLRAYYGKHREFPECVRKSWESAINIEKEFSSMELDEFF